MNTRQRCFSTGNHGHGAGIATAYPDRSTIEDSPCSAATLLTGQGICSEEDKYYKKATKASYLRTMQRRRRIANQRVGRFLKKLSVPSLVTRVAGFAMILSALLVMWRHCSARSIRHSSGTVTSTVSRVRLLREGEQDGEDLVYEQAAQRIQAIHQDTRDDAGASLYEMKERILEQQYQHQLEKREQRVEQEERRLEHKRRVTLAERAAAQELQSSGAKRQKTTTEKLLVHSIDQLQEMFLHALSQKRNENEIPEHLRTYDDEIRTSGVRKLLTAWLYKVDQDTMNNTKGGTRWVLPILLPDPSKPVRGDGKNPISNNVRRQQQLTSRNLQALQARVDPNQIMRNQMFFQARRETTDHSLTWESEWKDMHTNHANDASSNRKLSEPLIDYTMKDKYKYPEIQLEQPPQKGGYPMLKTLSAIMENWDQDEDSHQVIEETLMHFNFSNPAELEMAKRFRDAELPFKLYDIPEISLAKQKWTDEYITEQFEHGGAEGFTQESPNHYFAYFATDKWEVETMGIPPVRKNKEWSWNRWSQHARYADASRLSSDQPHFYFQTGVVLADENGTYVEDDTFISRDLSSFSSSSETFFMFQPDKQKAIECRFGERGTVVSNHYDAGRNMVGMIGGAKRYILSPPKSCSRLGVTTSIDSPIFRQSLLDLGHLRYLNSDKQPANSHGHMSKRERMWLERAAQAEAVETVLKAGEVLYIPSFWFHYIISLQKSAQCNVRSGVNTKGTREFGGEADILEGNC